MQRMRQERIIILKLNIDTLNDIDILHIDTEHIERQTVKTEFFIILWQFNVYYFSILI